MGTSTSLQVYIHKNDSETGKDTGVRAARHYQTQSAATGTESLWRFMHMAGNLRTWRVRTLTI